MDASNGIGRAAGALGNGVGMGTTSVLAEVGGRAEASDADADADATEAVAETAGAE